MAAGTGAGMGGARLAAQAGGGEFIADGRAETAGERGVGGMMRPHTCDTQRDTQAAHRIWRGTHSTRTARVWGLFLRVFCVCGVCCVSAGEALRTLRK